MTKALTIAASLALVALLYLLLWPVPIDPVAWQAPVDQGLVDPYEQNKLLQVATSIDLGTFEGPEDAALGSDGYIYVTTHSGDIVRVRNRRVELVTRVAGRPLGIEADSDGTLVIANSYAGLQRVSTDGNVTTLLSEIAEKYGGTYEASLLDIVEHGGHGRVLMYDPSTGQVETLLEGLNFANGVALSSDDNFLVVAETGHYRVLKHWLTGEKRGTTEILLENLPGFPDNIKSGLAGRFWLGFAAPRNQLIDRISDRPWLRKMVQRLPAAVRPKAVPASHVIAFNDEGTILMNMHDPDARFPTITGVVETQRSLYLTSLFGNALPVVAKSDL
jgi:sugar lactone lactonase YvrE